MNPTMTIKMVTRYESGLLSAAEVANSLLYELVSEPGIDTAFLSSVKSLPDEVRHEFILLLRRIQEADFHWTPFLIPALTTPFDSAERCAKLRQVCALMGEQREQM